MTCHLAFFDLEDGEGERCAEMLLGAKARIRTGD